MSKIVLVTCIFTILISNSNLLCAQGLLATGGPLVDHPVLHPVDGRSSSSWRSGVGTWGENFAEETLRLRGFNELHEIKHGGNNGVDRIAIKRGLNGKIIDVKFVEVKTSRASTPRLGQTRYGGKQMSRKWLDANLRIMHNSGDPNLKTLALEISRYLKSTNNSIESIGEVMHFNPKSGRLIGYAADGTSLRYSQSIEGLLTNIQSKAGSRATRTWATRTLSQFDQIRASSMSDWLGKSVAQQSEKAIISNSGRSTQAARLIVLRESQSEFATTVLRRSAGRIALFAALAVDAKNIFDTEYAYQNGTISVRQRNIQLASTIGAAGVAFAGASAGGIAGVWIGGFGGPVAWATVPLCGLAGAVIGGVGGYFGGYSLAEYGATAWYDSIDESVRDKFELAWLNKSGAFNE